MGVYLRGRWYCLRRQIEGREYWRSLRLRKGQEALLSERLQRVEADVLARHYRLPARTRKTATLSEFFEDYRKRKEHKRSLDRDVQRFEIALRTLGDRPLHTKLNHR